MRMELEQVLELAEVKREEIERVALSKKSRRAIISLFNNGSHKKIRLKWNAMGEVTEITKE